MNKNFKANTGEHLPESKYWKPCKVQVAIPHFLPPSDALHQCGSTIQRYQNSQNKMGTETPP